MGLSFYQDKQLRTESLGSEMLTLFCSMDIEKLKRQQPSPRRCQKHIKVETTVYAKLLRSEILAPPCYTVMSKYHADISKYTKSLRSQILASSCSTSESNTRTSRNRKVSTERHTAEQVKFRKQTMP